MSTDISHGQNTCDAFANTDNINNNKMYKVLTTIENEPTCRSALERKLPHCWRVLKRAIDKKFVVKIDKIYYITEDGLDKIDLLEIRYGIYQG